MMNLYLRNRNDRRSSRGTLFGITVLVAIIFVFDLVSGGLIRFYVRSISSSIFAAGASIGTHMPGSQTLMSRADLEAQNHALQEEINRLQDEAARATTLEQENSSLKDLLHVAGANVGITAPVTSSVESSPYGTFLIGAGSGEGVVKGQLVLTPGGFVVGTISDVGAHTATVSEIFAPLTKIDVTIDGTPVTLTGSGADNAQGNYPRDLPLSLSAPAIAPTLGGRPVGLVGKISSSSAMAAQDIYLRLPASLSSLRYVYVVTQ
jgi:cell shape-determining protein MreC